MMALLAMSATAQATVLGTNLIVNPDAEARAGANSCHASF
jgi:hypothetical protein